MIGRMLSCRVQVLKQACFLHACGVNVHVHPPLSTVATVYYTSRMARHSTLNVSLTAKLEKYVRSKVNSGGYESASEVIRESLRALQDREHAAMGFWACVREKVAVGRRQVAEGRMQDGEEAMAEIMAELGENRPARGRAKKRRR
jgi:antitoxin ParD1/3/4